MLGLPEAIDITAALARCAMSLTEAPPFAGFVSTDSAAGASEATLAGAGCGAVSLDFGVSTGANSEASFGASAGFEISGDGEAAASFDASVCGAGSTAWGAAAAKRSSNLSVEVDATAGAVIAGAGSGKEAKTLLTTVCGFRAATDCERRITGLSKFPPAIDG